MRTHWRTYLIPALLLVSCVLLSACKSPAEQRVCFFGSSVCRGVGADALHGYAAQVTEALPAGWESVNISIDGNNTYDLFARFDRDMTPVEAKYVVIGISLGNEGLHEKGARAMLSYRENMPCLIRMLQEQGRVVVVTNNYPRADFNEVDYADLCDVNLEVQQWDVPTINVFGTIDDGAGRWAAHLWNGSDIYHPNQLGHEAMASAFPKSKKAQRLLSIGENSRHFSGARLFFKYSMVLGRQLSTSGIRWRARRSLMISITDTSSDLLLL